MAKEVSIKTTMGSSSSAGSLDALNIKKNFKIDDVKYDRFIREFASNYKKYQATINRNNRFSSNTNRAKEKGHKIRNI